MKKTGYVFSGGGARGIAHLGVLRLLNENGIKPFAISGTSAGAIVGALYASGQSPEQILEAVKTASFFGWLNIRWHKDAVFSIDPLRKLLTNIIGNRTFEQLNTRLFVATTDIIKGVPVIHSTGPVVETVIASSAVPGIFEPIRIDGGLLVDGGVLNNFPIDPLLGLCDVIIGSHVNRQEKNVHADLFSNAVNILDRAYHLAISNSVYARAHQSDILIDHSLTAYPIYDLKNADGIFEAGYKEASKYRDQILRLVED
jgi:NTE family protein